MASICSVTRIVPSSAAIEAAIRAPTTRAVKIGIMMRVSALAAPAAA